MSDNKLVSIKDMSKNFKTKAELQSHYTELMQLAGAQEMQLQKLIKELEDKSKEIDHLKSMLAKAVPIIGGAEQIIPSDEELIAEMQLAKLKDRAHERDLTLEEARKFEIFSKIKHSTKNPDDINAGYKKLTKGKSEVELLEIAQVAAEETKAKDEDE